MGAAPLGDQCGVCSAPWPETVLGAMGHILPAPRTVPNSSHPVPKLGTAAGAQGVAGPRAQQGHGAARLGLQCCLCAVRGTPGCHRARRAPAAAAEVLGVSWASRRPLEPKHSFFTPSLLPRPTLLLPSAPLFRSNTRGPRAPESPIPPSQPCLLQFCVLIHLSFSRFASCYCAAGDKK